MAESEKQRLTQTKCIEVKTTLHASRLELHSTDHLKTHTRSRIILDDRFGEKESAIAHELRERNESPFSGTNPPLAARFSPESHAALVIGRRSGSIRKSPHMLRLY